MKEAEADIGDAGIRSSDVSQPYHQHPQREKAEMASAMAAFAKTYDDSVQTTYLRDEKGSHNPI